MRRQLRRSGVTLIEVLIAILILSVGMISVMAFFPIGAMNMVQSFKDERCAQGAHNADALMRVCWRDWYIRPDNNERTDFDLLAPLPPNYPAIPGPSQMADEQVLASINVFRYLDNWNWPAGATGIGTAIDDFNMGPSWPVLIDPTGMATQSVTSTSVALPPTLSNPTGMTVNATRGFVGNVPGLVTRVDHPAVTAPSNPLLLQQRLRLSTLPDDMSFKVNGEPTDVENGGQLDRGYRYSYAWLIQRQNNNSAPINLRPTAKLFILAFDGRPYADVSTQELVFSLDGRAPDGVTPVNGGQIIASGTDSSSILLQYNTERPPLKKGGYVMLGFVNPSDPLRRPVIDFFRTSSIDDEGTNQIRLNLDRGLPGIPAYAVIFEKLGEVFRRDDLNPSSYIHRAW